MGLEEDIQKDIEKVKELKEGINQFNGHPLVYEICEENEEINKGQPARWMAFRTSEQTFYFEGIREICIVGVWNGVPNEYKPILVIHELREHDTGSHELAREYETEFAYKFLGKKRFNEYLEWRRQYDP
ncbi:MAG: hypothetical protein ABIA37_01105 [Candidatus Woesearchaeota archaeon]